MICLIFLIFVKNNRGKRYKKFKIIKAFRVLAYVISKITKLSIFLSIRSIFEKLYSLNIRGIILKIIICPDKSVPNDPNLKHLKFMNKNANK